ncbi:MAG: acyl-CoA thioesterase [Acidobacteria bacterium]|nr:MAG: acyl-CoA thioesterase [Acidobacteriota bacterium]
MEAKTVAESRTTMTEVVLPNDTSAYGMILGGKVMHLIDMAGAVAAYRHCRNPVVTVSVDSVRFLNSIRVGQLVLLEAFVTRAFTTSMEVEVHVHSEDPLTGKQIKTSDAFLTFVAIDKDGRPTAIPPLRPETADEKRRYESAMERRTRRLAQKG